MPSATVLKADCEAADWGSPNTRSKHQVKTMAYTKKKAIKPRFATNATQSEVFNHSAMTGTKMTASPPSKPVACATRRTKDLPRTAWRDSHRSKIALNT